METETTTTVPDIAKQLDSSVLAVMGAATVRGFERAFLIADATAQLKALLTPEYMRPIMELQGNRLGFRTDQDKNGGYNEQIVKNCLIEAVLTGLQPVGNQFNIIAGNMYPTKEGLGYLLANFKGLSYKIIPSLPRINSDKTSAAVDMTVRWSLNGGEQNEEVIPIPIRVNNGMGTDAIIGKATRKARAWLYSTITGNEIGEGDVTDTDAQVISSRKLNRTADETELDRKKQMLADCKSIFEVDTLQVHNPDWDIELFKSRKEELKNAAQ